VDLLITGGAGFIGSTIASAALDAGHRAIILDSLVTGRREFTYDRIFYEGDIADRDLLDRILDNHPDIEMVIHCAALIVVPESVERPADYYRANVVKTLDLVEGLLSRGVTNFIFSSSASIYRPEDDFSVDENSALEPTSPYARTKVVVEGMLEDISRATDLRVMSLRYFNPIGADPQFRTGLQHPFPSHALGKLIEARNNKSPFRITGVDYGTRDGSGIRDYIHVSDLAKAHLAALDNFDAALGDEHYCVINLGTGTGTTVRELVVAFNEMVDEPITVVSAPRRPGDGAGAFTRSDKAARLLKWQAEHTLRQGIADSLEWFRRRPEVLPDLT
jgi:UDP-glucose 4-epimerase